MSYTSDNLPATDASDLADVRPSLHGFQSGYLPRDWSAEPLGFRATPFDLPIIPRSEWKDRVREREKAKATNRELRERFKIVSLNQANTNYCWANAPVQALHYLMVQQGNKLRRLSPASVAAPIKGFQNVGGWGNQALDRIIEHGVNEVSDWPPNAIDRRYFTKENAEKAKLNRVEEWWDLPRRDFDALFTALLNGFTVAVGYNWWGHEVLAIDPAFENDKPIVIIDNSWGNWGDKGLGKLSEAKARPDDAVCPRSFMSRAT